MFRESKLHQLLPDGLDFRIFRDCVGLPVHGIGPEVAPDDQRKKQKSRIDPFYGTVAHADRGRGDCVSGLVQLPGQPKQTAQNDDLCDQHAPAQEALVVHQRQDQHHEIPDQHPVSTVGRQTRLFLDSTDAVSQSHQDQKSRD